MLLTIALILASIEAFAQSPVRVAPDCVIGLNATAATRSNAWDNRDSTCTEWDLAYTSTGFSALSIEVDFATDSGGQPGTWTVWPSGNVVGIIPLTVTTNGYSSLSSFQPWVSINLTSVTGTGLVKAMLIGWKSALNQADDPCFSTKQFKQALITTATTTKLVADLAGAIAYVCGYAITSTATTAENTVQFTSGTGGSCATGTNPMTPVKHYGILANGSVVDSHGWANATLFSSGVTGQGICLVSTVGTAPNISVELSYVQR
jgi:hypothetical protein